MSKSWVSKRRRVRIKEERKEARTHPTLIVRSPLIFAKRDKKGDLPHDRTVAWSEKSIRSASNNWSKVLVFYKIENPNQHILFLKTLEFLGISNFSVVAYPIDDPEEATRLWKQALVEHGGGFIPPRNPREVVYLNLNRYIDAPHFTWVGENDHNEAKVEIDKPKTFNDFQSMRKKAAQW